MVRWSPDSTLLLTLPVYLTSVSSRNFVKMEVFFIIPHENNYLEEIRILSWNMEQESVLDPSRHRTGTRKGTLGIHYRQSVRPVEHPPRSCKRS